MKATTKIVFLFCLVTVICVPVYVWAYGQLSGRIDVDMNGMGTFLLASAGPLGVLTGAMVGRAISRDRANGNTAGG